MKKLLTLGLGIVTMSLSISACSQEGAKPENEAPATEQTSSAVENAETPAVHAADAKTVKVSIDGMTCTSCVGRVDEALAGLEGVSSKNVSLEDNQCTVTYDPAQTDEKQIVAAIEKLEYKAELIN